MMFKAGDRVAVHWDGGENYPGDYIKGFGTIIEVREREMVFPYRVVIDADTAQFGDEDVWRGWVKGDRELLLARGEVKRVEVEE